MKQPTPKLDALRQMREDRYARTYQLRKSVAEIKEAVAAIPAKKPPRKKRR